MCLVESGSWFVGHTGPRDAIGVVLVVGWPLGAREICSMGWDGPLGLEKIFLFDVCIDGVISDQMGWPLGAGEMFLFDVCIDGVISDQMGWPLGARENFFV